MAAAGKATQQPSAVLRCLLFSALRLLCRRSLAPCLPKDSPSREMGGAGPGWQAGGPLLWGFPLVPRRAGLPVRATPCGPRAAPAAPGFAHAGHVPAAPGLACLACQSSRGRGSWMAGWSLESQSLCWALAPGRGGEGGINGTFVWPGAQAQAHLPLSFLDLPLARPSQPGGLARPPVLLAPPATPFQMNQPWGT